MEIDHFINLICSLKIYCQIIVWAAFLYIDLINEILYSTAANLNLFL